MCFTQDGYATVRARTSESAIFSDPRRFFYTNEKCGAHCYRYAIGYAYKYTRIE